MGRGAVGSSKDVARTIVGVGVGGVTHSTEQLAMVVVGVGNGAFSRGRIGGDVTHAVIGIAILLPAAGHRRHLHGGLDAVNILVGILPGDRAAGNGSQPPQTIVAHGQSCAYAGGHGIQTAVGRIVSIPLGIGCTAQLLALSGELVIGIVVLAGPQNGIAVLLPLTVDQAANGIIGIQIGNRAARSFAFASLRAVF